MGRRPVTETSCWPTQLLPPGQVIGLRASNRTGRTESHPTPARGPCESGCKISCRSSPLPAMLQPSKPIPIESGASCKALRGGVAPFPSQQAHRRSPSGHSLLFSPLPHATELHDACCPVRSLDCKLFGKFPHVQDRVRPRKWSSAPAIPW
jgi:hypothetical protein